MFFPSFYGKIFFFLENRGSRNYLLRKKYHHLILFDYREDIPSGKKSDDKTFSQILDFVKMTGPPRINQRIYADSDLVDLPAPMEELLTVTIDDTANTVFQTGIARIFCHMCMVTIPVFYIHEIMKATGYNPEVTCMLPGRRYFLNLVNKCIIIEKND
jgi:hypothetical protein